MRRMLAIQAAIRLIAITLCLGAALRSRAQISRSSSSASPLLSVHPDGAVNGRNRIFTLPQAPADPENVQVVENGRRLIPGRDYTLKACELEFTAPAVPHQGDIIMVSFHGGGMSASDERTVSAPSQEMQDLARQVLMEAILREGQEPTAVKLTISTKRNAEQVETSAEPADRVRSFSLFKRRPKVSGVEAMEKNVTPEERMSGFEGLGDVGIDSSTRLKAENAQTPQPQRQQSRKASTYRSIAMIQKQVADADRSQGSNRKRKDKQ